MCGEAREGGEESAVEVGRDAEGGAALGAEVEGLLGAGGEEVPAEEEGTGMEAIVAAEEADRGEEGEDGVVAGGVICGGPRGVVVGWEKLGERVDVFPGEGGEVGEVEGGGYVFDSSGDYTISVFSAGDGVVVEGQEGFVVMEGCADYFDSCG